MKLSNKPVRGCHSCLLNQGDHCWLYRYPRGQWRNGRCCRAFENESIYRDFRQWQKQPDVRTRRDLRRDVFRTSKRAEVHHHANLGSKTHT